MGEGVWVRSSEEPVPDYIEHPMQKYQTAVVAAGSADVVEVEVEVAEEVRKPCLSQNCREISETAVEALGPPILAFEEVPAMEAAVDLLSVGKSRMAGCTDSSRC